MVLLEVIEFGGIARKFGIPSQLFQFLGRISLLVSLVVVGDRRIFGADLDVVDGHHLDVLFADLQVKRFLVGVDVHHLAGDVADLDQFLLVLSRVLLILFLSH